MISMRHVLAHRSGQQSLAEGVVIVQRLVSPRLRQLSAYGTHELGTFKGHRLPARAIADFSRRAPALSPGRLVALQGHLGTAIFL